MNTTNRMAAGFALGLALLSANVPVAAFMEGCEKVSAATYMCKSQEGSKAQMMLRACDFLPYEKCSQWLERQKAWFGEAQNPDFKDWVEQKQNAASELVGEAGDRGREALQAFAHQVREEVQVRELAHQRLPSGWKPPEGENLPAERWQQRWALEEAGRRIKEADRERVKYARQEERREKAESAEARRRAEARERRGRLRTETARCNEEYRKAMAEGPNMSPTQANIAQGASIVLGTLLGLEGDQSGFDAAIGSVDNLAQDYDNRERSYSKRMQAQLQECENQAELAYQEEERLAESWHQVEIDAQKADEQALISAAAEGEIAVVRSMLDKGVNPNVQNSGVLPPLCRAAEGGHVEVVHLLLDAGADVNAHISFHDSLSSALHYAVSRGHVEVARLLLDGKADVNANTNDRDAAPLHLAENAQVTRLLLASGANVGAQDWEGDTPLGWAAASNRVEVARELLDGGADVNAKNWNGRTPLYWAAKSGDYAEVTRVLLEAGADANVQDEYGDTPLHWAAASDHAKVAGALLDAGADVHARNGVGNTPEQVAAHNDHTEMTRAMYAAARGDAAEARALLNDMEIHTLEIE